jgi:predicted DNA-binding transcriptional regulator YafY
MTKAAYRALHIRSEALNNLYGNAVTRLSPAQFAAYWNAGASRLSPDEFNALVVRSEGLNSYGKTLQASTPVASTSASTSFAWHDFGIGMAAAFGLVLLTGGLAVAVRTADLAWARRLVASLGGAALVDEPADLAAEVARDARAALARYAADAQPAPSSAG